MTPGDSIIATFPGRGVFVGIYADEKKRIPPLRVVACKLGPELYEVPPFCQVSAVLGRFRNPSYQTSFVMRDAAFDTPDPAVHAG